MASELARAYVQIVPTAQGMKGQLEELLGKESTDTGKQAGTNIGNSIGAFIKKTLAVIGIGSMITSAIMEGANLEQSLGGIETLFKESSDEIVAYANDAWKTAGMSANDYMETATSFAASLLQGVAGDTEQAAKITDMAITDMSDNANKMGTDMEAIQNAYQGFAKQNYTMLDNLKLGYGGTKSEMERLLADARELTGVEYNIDNLADVYNAIHVIQNELHISGLSAEEAAQAVADGLMTEEEAFEAMGTTAKEASTTISGSINAVKGAWANLQADMVLGKDVTGDIQALSESVITAASNLLPAIANLLGSLPSVLVKVIQEIGPPLISAILETIATVASTIGENLPELIETFLKSMFSIIDAVIDNLPVIVAAGIQLLMGFVTGILEALPNLISQVPIIVSTVLTTLLDLIPDVVKAGLTLFTSLVEDLPDIITNIVNIIPTIINAVINCICELIPLIIDTGVELLTALVTNLPLIIKAIIQVIPQIINSISDTFAKLTPLLFEVGFQLFTAIIELLPEILLALMESVYEIVDGIISVFTECFPHMRDVGKEMIAGIWQGIKNGWGNLVTSVKGLAKQLMASIKEVFGIHSPSAVFRDEIGKNLDLGLAEGITGNMDAVNRAMEELTATASIDPVLTESITYNPGEVGVGKTNDELLVLNSMYAYMQQMLPVMAKKNIVMDSGALVGALAPGMDVALGDLIVKNKRRI